MRARWGGALAAAALAASAGARAAESGCELARVDRRTATSLACSGCHGQIATAALSRGPGGHPLGHPIDVDYAALAEEHPDRFAPAASLPPDVPLPSGKIACTTCHDGAARDHRKLVAPTRVLCLACHRL
jgi:predicted CXXCH cytochrome family protein